MITGWYQVYAYLLPAAWIVGWELWAVHNDRPRDTITAMVESSPLFWVPMVVLCAWALGHFTFGLRAEKVLAFTALIAAPVIWFHQRPFKRKRG